MNIVDNIGSVFSYVTEIGKRILVGKASNKQSLVSFTKPTRVEPITMIDNRLQSLPYLTDVLQTMSSIMAAYFSQSISLITHVSNINVIRTLDKLNPKRDVNWSLVEQVNRDSGINSKYISESYIQANLEHHGIGLENDKLNDLLTPEEKDDMRKEMAKTNGRLIINSNLNKPKLANPDISKTIHENVNLAVGKVIQVQIGDKEHGAVFPVSIRLLSNLMSPDVLIHILGDGNRNVRLKERWHGWRSGELQFWRDMVLCSDLIDAHRKALTKDTSGVYAEILKRRRGNSIKGAITGEPSIGTASNMLVVSKRLIQDLERHAGGSWNSPAFRSRVFDSSYLMVIAVVDPDRELVSFYHRGIDVPSQMSIREIKVSNGKGGPDIMEIMDSLLKSKAPSF